VLVLLCGVLRFSCGQLFVVLFVRIVLLCFVVLRIGRCVAVGCCIRLLFLIVVLLCFFLFLRCGLLGLGLVYVAILLVFRLGLPFFFSVLLFLFLLVLVGQIRVLVLLVFLVGCLSRRVFVVVRSLV